MSGVETDRVAARFARQRAERAEKWAKTTDEQLLRMRIEESAAQGWDPVFAACLSVSVPMWIDKMRHWPASYRERKAHELCEITAYSQAMAAIADPEARGTEKKGTLALAFNAISQGCACLAFCPGGIVFAGHHWEAHS